MDTFLITGSTYPSGSSMLYSSSYVFTTVTTFNEAIPIQRGTGATFNQLHYVLPDTKYAIYGITRFQLPRDSTNTCSTISINATLDNINQFTVTTPNSNPTDIFFAADIFTKNVDTLCNTGTGF